MLDSPTLPKAPWSARGYAASAALFLSALRTLLMALLCLGGGWANAQDRHTVVDLAGRSVELPRKIDRILLGEGRLLPVLGLLEHEDPARRLVAMMGDYETLDPAGYGQWRDAFPELDRVMRIGRTDSGSFSDEQAIAQQPQLAIFSLAGGHGPSKASREIISRLEAAGTAVVFVDFRQDPLKNTPVSMRLLGQVLDRSARANAFADEWQRQLARVQDVLTGPSAPQKNPSVFLENRVGLSDECCATMVGLVGVLLDAAGGDNVARGLIPGEHGTLNPELLIGQQPRIYLGTGIGQIATARQTPLRIVLGADATPDEARKSLARALKRPFISELTAVKEGRAFAVWHHFYNSPFNVVAVQAMAKWMHPEAFQDLDPVATMQKLYTRFMPIPLQGVYWTGL
jgi:iron complex transport system substrate-binding protein